MIPAGVDPVVRDLLVCPRCRGDLVDVDGALQCDACRLRYPVVDGIPWLVEDRARAVTD